MSCTILQRCIEAVVVCMFISDILMSMQYSMLMSSYAFASVYSVREAVVECFADTSNLRLMLSVTGSSGSGNLFFTSLNPWDCMVNLIGSRT